MSTQVAKAREIAPLPMGGPAEEKQEGRAPGAGLGGEMTGAFAAVRPVGGDAPDPGALEPAHLWSMLTLVLPRAIPSQDSPADIAVPPAIAGDSRRRIIFRLGVSSARELGLDAGALGTEEVMALGRQTVADHVAAGTADSVFVAMARAEGKVDDAAWAARDTGKIAEQVDAFARAEFQDEIALHEALAGLAAEPAVPGRRELADTLLREQGIDIRARLGGHDVDSTAFLEGALDYERSSIAGSSAPLIRKWQAGEAYFNQDTLTADLVRKMKMRGGGTPSDEQVAQILRALPPSLEAEFTRRFDAHQRTMSALLADWITARLSLHAREAGIDLRGTTITISRAQLRFSRPPMGVGMYSSGATIRKPLRGFMIAIQKDDTAHRCFISSRTGAVHTLAPEETVESWLRKEHELAFDDAATCAELAERGGKWFTRIVPEHVAFGAHDEIRERLLSLFHGEIEQGREALRGQNVSEGLVDEALNLIPFRAMVVALRKGDIPTAVVMGGLDVLSWVPLVGAGVRLGGAAARSAAPWLTMGMRLGGTTARQGVTGGLRHLAGSIPMGRERIKAALAESAIRAWGRLRPLDVQRVATALRATSPKLADMLAGIATRTRGATVPDGVWRVGGRGAASAPTGNAIGAMPAVTARSPQGGQLGLLAYGDRTGCYTQIDAAGQRIGALLVADSGGWLHQTMPVASLERYRVASADVLDRLAGKPARPDGTRVLDHRHYARLGADYVEVTPDFAVSTGTRPIWRVVAPRDAVRDVIAHRLIHDPDEGLWRQASVPGLAGGMKSSPANAPASGGHGHADVAAAQRPDVRLSPDTAQLTRLRDAMVDSMQGATPAQVQALRTLLDRIGADERGQAILNALSAQYELLSVKPRIVLAQEGSPAGTRPSLDQPVPGDTWSLNLEALGAGPTDAAVDELAAVYNNMTGLLQNEDPFAALLAAGQPPIDARLESAWTQWLRDDPEKAAGVDTAMAGDSATGTSRELTVHYLRTWCRQSACYGGVDPAAFKALLRREYGPWTSRLDLSHRGLDSIPPLPVDMEDLNVASNPIRDWSNLPDGLLLLDARDTGMAELPPNLPPALESLDLADNRLGRATLVLPTGLKWLRLANNRLTAMPALPDTLEELIVSHNRLETMPARWPAGLEVLDISDNALTRLPETWPPKIEVLHAERNRLEQLPALPEGLEELYVSSNRLRHLPRLPDTLHVLHASMNALTELPANLPAQMESIVVSHNRLRNLPDHFPPELWQLDLRNNDIRVLPASVVGLELCTIFLSGNSIPAQTIPVITGPGPRILLNSTEQGLSQAVALWMSGGAPQAQRRWDLLEPALGRRPEVVEFAGFLDRLRTSISARDPGFRAQVQAWLEELSKPERRTLLDETLAVCQGATETCEDRIVATWNGAHSLRINDDIRLGMYDERVDEVIDTARQMFRIGILTEIARRRERGSLVRDPVALYLAYVVTLRDSLRLTTVAPAMRFEEMSGLTAKDVDDARAAVQAREREEFDAFLVLDYEPWQTLLRRKDPQAYTQAEQEAHRLLEAGFEQELREELERNQLDPRDSDARAQLGRIVMRRIRYRALAPLTLPRLQAAGLQSGAAGMENVAV